MNDKYVVFKIDDWDNFEKALDDPDAAQFKMGYAIDDAEVIRHQDVFASPGFYAYAAVIQTGLDVDVLVRGNLSAEERETLENNRDHFFQAAEAAKHVRKKIPD